MPANFPYKLGCTFHEDGIRFALQSPLADQVNLCIYREYDQDALIRLPMQRSSEGIWQHVEMGFDWENCWYTYSIQGPTNSAFFEASKFEIADPYALYVANTNHYLGFYKALIKRPTPFDWSESTQVLFENPSDLIIYEAHIKDLVAHPSAKAENQGAYLDFIEARKGGLHHLKQLGVNAVEFLPLQKFAYYEPPFQQRIESGLKNTWNPTSVNYWGYMTSFFHAPETLYASGAKTDPMALVGTNPSAEYELKSLIKACHLEGIAVIMDVVYNHASQYDLNPLKYSDKGGYYRLDHQGNYLNDSWTGNDLDTTKEATKQLIFSSVKHWLTEYKVDGFRFDLAGILDWSCIDELTELARSIHPGVMLIAEPWGGEYKPTGFSERNWPSWNDTLRNTFKGYDPVHQRGILFGEWPQGIHRYTIENLFRGTLLAEEHGLFHHSSHSVNYVESHDGYTLGDFIRTALKHDRHHHQQDHEQEAEHDIEGGIEQEVIRLQKLAGFMLFVSQGICMIHAGQEWARSKAIASNENQGTTYDHDSYNKDSDVNYLNFDEKDRSMELFTYYKRLIEIRNEHKALKNSAPEAIVFKVYQDPLHITFSIDGHSVDSPYSYFISINCNRTQSHEIILPEGKWEVLITDELVPDGEYVESSYLVPYSSCILLRQKQ